TPHVDRCLRRIRDLGCESGLALNISTPLSAIDYLYDKLDMLLIMTINPGFGGQSFLPLAYPRIRAAREMLDRLAPATRIQVDGGVKRSNIAAIVAAGADTIVAGTEIFESEDFRQTISELRSNALSARRT
ncbi:MAG TPA: ribulose-phosphate 3-epimerase, partial [Roseiarcus sp.]